MGDVVRTLASVRAIRSAYPNARISWLVERAAACVLEGCSDLDEVLLFPREELSANLRAGRVRSLWVELRGFTSALRNRKFDLVLDFHSILKSGVISYLSGAPSRVTYAPPYGREWGWLLANHRVRLDPPRASRFERNAGLVRYLGIDFPAKASEGLDSLIAIETGARDRMERSFSGERFRILIHPGSSSHTAYKRYKPESYADLARGLEARIGSRTLVCRGTTSGEEALAERIVEASGGAAKLAPETPALSDLVAVIDRAQLFIGSDSGPLHIAAMLGTPVVQLVGPTDPVENQPWDRTPGRQVRVPVACSPCRRGCAAATCMQVIPHEMILEAALELLESASSPRSREVSIRVLATAASSSPACL
jgi:heptosyltransferase-1